jgi:hypothetical protein
VAERTFADRIIGKTSRERKRRRQLATQTVTWLVVGAIGIVVVAMIGQFVSRIWITPPVTSERERTDLLVKKGERIQLTVLNGSGQQNIARTFTDFLRARKFDVVEMSNYKQSDVEHSFVIDKVMDTVAAKKLAYAIGIEDNRIVHEPDSNAFVDAAIVIGKDFQALKPMK